MLDPARDRVPPGAGNVKLIAVVVLVVCVAPVQAHHSLSEYDVARKLTLNVTVREFRFVNPHPFLLVESRAGGLVAVWRLELDNRFELVEIGMNANTFVSGDHLLVTGSPGQNQKPILYVRELDRPSDGFRYEQVGSTPRIVRPSRSVN
jgi:hypothetical protein